MGKLVAFDVDFRIKDFMAMRADIHRQGIVTCLVALGHGGRKEKSKSKSGDKVESICIRR